MIRKKAAVAFVAVASAFVFASSAASASATAVVPIRYIPWSEQTVFALAPDRSYIAEWNGLGQGWTIIGGAAQQVYAGSAGVFMVDLSGNIWIYNGTPNSWTEIGGPGYQFAEAAGHLYGIAPDKSYVAEWNGLAQGGWTIIGGAASEIAVGGAGLVALSPKGDAILLYDGTPGQWTQIGGGAWDISVDARGIYRTDTVPDTIEQWIGGTSWETIGSGSAGVSIAADGPVGLFAYGVGPAGDDPTGNAQYEYNGTPGSWTKVGVGTPTGLETRAVSRTYVFGVTTDINSDSTGIATSVELYTGGENWTVIGGPAYKVIAAGD